MALDIHPANDEERRQAHANVHDVWSRGLSAEQLVERREQAPHHRFAQWFVGTEEGRVVTSLASHPFEFHLAGEVVPGIGIASVHTLPACRGRGFAPRLIDWVERRSAARGAALSLLFSDVEPSYYARLAYTLCPAWEGWWERSTKQPGLAAGEIAARAQPWTLVPCAARLGLAQLADLYNRHHAASPLFVHRYRAYWQNLLDRRPHDEFFFVHDPAAGSVGYVRFSPLPEPLWLHDPAPADGAWKLSDYALADPSPASLDRLLALVMQWVHERNGHRIGGWLPESPIVRQWFPLAPRQEEITMFKSLAGPITWTADLLTAAGNLREIDHV